jgi:hypothetical protein
VRSLANVSEFAAVHYGYSEIFAINFDAIPPNPSIRFPRSGVPIGENGSLRAPDWCVSAVMERGPSDRVSPSEELRDSAKLRLRSRVHFGLGGVGICELVSQRSSRGGHSVGRVGVEESGS